MLFSVALKELLFTEIKKAWAEYELRKVMYCYSTLGDFISNYLTNIIMKIQAKDINGNIEPIEFENMIELFRDADAFDDGLYDLNDATNDFQFVGKFLIALLDDLDLSPVLLEN